MKRTARKTDTTNQHAIAYLRVSTIGQAEDGVSLDAQQSKIAAWCAVMGYELVETYADEGISGHSMMKRYGLQQAVDAVCACGGVLVVYSLSRLARNTQETLELGNRLAKAGADLVSLSEKIDTTSAAGKMVFRMLAVLAEFERDQVSERTTMALAYKESQQERVGELPYGFQEGPDGKLIEHAGEQANIAMIRRYRAEGLSLRAIVGAATKAGLLSRAGQAISTYTGCAHLREGCGVMPRPDELARLRDLQARCEADFRAIATQHPELCTTVAQRRFYGYICQQIHTQGGHMPSKGYRTMGEELENVAMRLPMSVVAQVDAHIDTLRKGAPWAKVGRSDALRDLVVRGLQSLSQPPPQPPKRTLPPAMTQQPALPLALEGVSASERVQPMTPAPQQEAQPETRQVPHASPGQVNCAVNPKHRSYSASAKECPMCANNRRTREHKARNKEKAQE